MLRQVYIILNDKIIYHRKYAKGIEPSLLINVYLNIKKGVFAKFGKTTGTYEFFESRILYTVEKDLNVVILFVLGFSDDITNAKPHILQIKKKFLALYGHSIEQNSFFVSSEELGAIVDEIQRNFRAKISIVGLSGVGKTTTTKLLKSEEIPMEHIPTITGKVATIKLEGVNLYLWDFAGQNEFDYLWENFLAGTDAILLMTESTRENLEKSKRFIEISKKVAPFARLAVIANKQDLPNAMRIEEIEEIMGTKIYGFVAIKPDSREKMIRIIADLLDINPEISTMLKPIFERDICINKGNEALDQGNLEEAVKYFDKASYICLDLGDQSQANEFKIKADKLRIFIN
ncbi:MAG: ADP-ribosylation factor-like protein [Promethearchaeota archaeon]|jgi:ADP-ribosylation factor related protein 1